jgi:lipopolysaccharide biosynthesis glycosyltransferase
MIESGKTKFSDASLRSPGSPQGREMEVLCACDERYLPHAATMLCSLLEHNSVSRIHLFHSSVASRELARLKTLVVRYKSDIVFYEIVAADFQDLRVDKWASTAVYYRILASRMLPTDVDKVLYLDSDMIVRQSLNDLWNTDVTGHALAAVSNYWNAQEALGLPVGTRYFNSGVLLINLRFWRQNNVPERAIAFVKNNPEKVLLWDQDALNATLIHQWIKLPQHWNWHALDDWERTPMPEAGKDPAIVHFVSSNKPWHWYNGHPFKDEYHKYRLKTPWRSTLPQRVGRSLRSFAGTVLPGPLRQWLRSRIISFQVGHVHESQDKITLKRADLTEI